MKAAYIEKFGGPEVLTYGTLPDPVAAAGQVVVDTAAASVNGADPKVVRAWAEAFECPRLHLFSRHPLLERQTIPVDETLATRRVPRAG